jgi:hypothetical protein
MPFDYLQKASVLTTRSKRKRTVEAARAGPRRPLVNPKCKRRKVAHDAPTGKQGANWWTNCLRALGIRGSPKQTKKASRSDPNPGHPDQITSVAHKGERLLYRGMHSRVSERMNQRKWAIMNNCTDQEAESELVDELPASRGLQMDAA